METSNFDALLTDYKAAVDRWVQAIRAEESLATSDHSIVQMERWDDAGFVIQRAEDAVKAARVAYQDALRQKNYGF
jgi:hypothetical protein